MSNNLLTMAVDGPLQDSFVLLYTILSWRSVLLVEETGVPGEN